MTVLHTVASLHPNTGGPARTVGSTCRYLAELGLNVEIVSRRASGAPALVPDHHRVQATFAESGSWWRSAVVFQQTLSGRIGSGNPTLIHDHGVWLPSNLVSAVEAHRQGKPLVVTTRGMLEPWALNHQGWKKKTAWHAYQRRILQSASLLHATSTMEAENLRALGLTPPIVTAPNGVPLPDDWKTSPSNGTERTALFLSRVHPKKGLPMLLDAWADVGPDDWRLLIVGPDENGHRAELEEQVDRKGLSEVVTFHSPVEDTDKWPLYRESDLFVLPTHSENFGVVVAEALASGIPAITTTGAPWRDLKEYGCGWWVEPEPESIRQALDEATNTSDDERLGMGRRGRGLVREKYSWDGVARKLNAAYEWVLGKRRKPDCVRVD